MLGNCLCIQGLGPFPRGAGCSAEVLLPRRTLKCRGHSSWVLVQPSCGEGSQAPLQVEPSLPPFLPLSRASGGRGLTALQPSERCICIQDPPAVSLLPLIPVPPKFLLLPEIQAPEKMKSGNDSLIISLKMSPGNTRNS